ncbi:transcriptional regulator [Paenibacillus sp. SSG-1]|uniref:MerR family transcriptional regulator n=1 Tax=Paenibacillus cineris TaxID=237530 RepID=A0ABQ4LJR6_9BACL|nr:MULTISPECIES: MerR family transcriptional regulator [Paenibacillus]OXL85712.1 transcriptional regulator [Paenibacillus sp. SSG-1]UYO06565.1 MerR family transcriptional regulator [Paenibacillus sp. PSB04]GIO56763.1 MerR family transcriptional regulator [Paenibacillus cineris]GIO64201.1 MerR family transcriptional regulator [Paenibacillus cineris]
MSRQYSISEIAEQTGLTSDTLRYYEKIGLIPSPQRGPGGSRLYSQEDIGKIHFLLHLKHTEMPLKHIQEYIRAYDDQDEELCYRLLDEHRIRIEAQMAALNETLVLVKYKLDHFQEIKDG